MIVFNLAPGLVLMTRFALLAIASVVHVIIRVTAMTAGRGIILHSATGMTGTTGNLGMFVSECETRGTVIENRSFPAVHAMTGFALPAIFAGVHINSLVTI